MKPITPNLATRPFRNNSVVGTVLVAASLVLVMATVYNVAHIVSYGSSYAQVERELNEGRQSVAALEAERQTLAQEAQKRDFKRAFDRGRFANDLILKRSFSWTQLFNTLETVVPPDVMMTAIRPNVAAEGIVVRVDGVAKNHTALLALEDRLLSNPTFARVYPTNERRLNPSRPEITFALHFDYLPRRAAPPDQIASAAPQSDQGSLPANPVAQADSPEPAPTGPEVASPAVAGPAVASQTGPGPAEGPSVPTATPPAAKSGGGSVGIVGRDGRPRTPEALARLRIAPGGVFIPAGGSSVAPSDRKSPGRRKSSPKPASKSAPGSTADAGPGSTGSALPPAPPAEPVARRRSDVPPKGDPNLPWTLPRGRRAAAQARAASKKERTVPADRLDVPLAFVGQPVGEIYDAIARAHGVRFEIDPDVDQRAKVTVNLRGRKLEDALLLVSGLAGHRVTRQDDGVYRVVAVVGGAPIGDPELREEDLKPKEDQP